MRNRPYSKSFRQETERSSGLSLFNLDDFSFDKFIFQHRFSHVFWENCGMTSLFIERNQFILSLCVFSIGCIALFVSGGLDDSECRNCGLFGGRICVIGLIDEKDFNSTC